MRVKRKLKIDYEEKEMFTNRRNKKIKKTKSQMIYIIYILLIIIILITLVFFFIKIKILIIKTSNIKSKKYDYLIVGAGLYGATFNYFAKKAGKTTLVIEKRDNIGGNLYCEKLEGINVHKYGLHIFHTNDIKIWDFVNSLTHFIPYNNQSLFLIEKKLYKLPFNFMCFFNQSLNITIQENDKKRNNNKFIMKLIIKILIK